MLAVLPWALHIAGQRATAPGGIGGQCVDLANIWLLANVMPPVHANACDWEGLSLPGLKWEANTPTNAPAPGSLIVWRAYGGHGIGAYGHIAVALAADPMALVTVDQNWPSGAPCLPRMHDYVGVAGWHRPLP